MKHFRSLWGRDNKATERIDGSMRFRGGGLSHLPSASPHSPARTRMSCEASLGDQVA